MRSVAREVGNKQPVLKVLEHKVLYRGQRFHAAFPSIVRFSDGNLLLAFRRARDGQWLIPQDQRQDMDPLGRMDHMDSRSHITLIELDADGVPLGNGVDMLPVDPEAADQDPTLLILPNDNLLLAAFSWYPLPVDAAARMAGRAAPGEERPGCRFIYWGSHSALRGRAHGSWQAAHRYLQPDAGFGNLLVADGSKSVVGPVRGQPLWRDGEILLPIYGTVQEGCALFASSDHGQSWRYRGLIARDVDGKVAYQEPALCEDGHGGQVCFMRTAGADGRLAVCHSEDGVSWSEPRLHSLVGHPFHPLVLRDGRVLLSYGYRNKPFGIRARLLNDARQAPDSAEEIIIRNDGLCPDLGYPWAVELHDGRVLLTYYWTDAEGIRHIVGSWLELGD